MEKLKEYLKDSILNDLENNEKISDKVNLVFSSTEELKKYVEFFWNLSYNKMRYLNAINNYLHDRKYKKKKGRILGTKSKAMPDDIYNKLIEYVGKFIGEKQQLALEFEGIEAPRGEDTVEVKEKDIDFIEHKVTIHNQKKDRYYDITLNRDIEKKLKKFIAEHHEDIEDHNGFVFYSDNPVQKNQHISQKYLKTLVHNVLEILELNKVYGVAEGGRKLYLYSLHSLRGHAATRVMRKTNDLSIVQQQLDHQPNSAATTMLYIERDESKLDDAMRD